MNGTMSPWERGFAPRRAVEVGLCLVPYNAFPEKTLGPPPGRFALKSATERLRRGLRKKKRNGRSKKR